MKPSLARFLMTNRLIIRSSSDLIFSSNDLNSMMVKLRWLCLPFIITMLVACSRESSVYDIVWHDFADKKVKLQMYKGRWIVVNYWATWCKPCIEEMPVLQHYYQRFTPNIMVIGANIEHNDGFVSAEAIVQFSKKLNLTFPIVKANIEFNKTSLGHVKALPMTVIINPQGEITYTHLGMINSVILERYIEILRQ